MSEPATIKSTDDVHIDKSVVTMIDFECGSLGPEASLQAPSGTSPAVIQDDPAIPHGIARPTNTEFIAALAQGVPDGCSMWAASFAGDPGSGDWRGQAVGEITLASGELDQWASCNCYYSTAALAPDSNGTVSRTKACFRRLLVLVVDDAEQEGLQGTPTYILETSPGNFQIGIRLDPEDNDCADLGLVSALVTRLASQGSTSADRSGNNAVRYVRLPVGQNQKRQLPAHFCHRLTAWRPEQTMTLADAAKVFGVDLDEIRASATAETPAGNTSPPADSQSDKLTDASRAIAAGTSFHEPINIVSASLVASGTHPGAAVNFVRAMMNASHAPRDDRWKARYADIPRSVQGAVDKFNPPAPANDDQLFDAVGDLTAALKPIEWLVTDYLETDALAMMFGPSGSGKSFVAIDIAACVATGHPWHNSLVIQGGVYYVAGEGHNGIARRFAAWSRLHGVPLTPETPLFKSRHAVYLMNEGEAANLAAHIDALATKTGMPPRLVIVDTLARNMGEGDENVAKDIAKFIAHLEKHICRRWACTVLIVHHSGHDQERARGSSSIRAAMNQEIHVKFQARGVILMACTKMKDAEIPDDRSFKIIQVGLGTMDEDGEEIMGAGLRLEGDPFDFEIGPKANGAGRLKALEVITYLLEPGWENSVAASTRLGVAERSLSRSMGKLRERGLVTHSGSGPTSRYELTDMARDMAANNFMTIGTPAPSGDNS